MNLITATTLYSNKAIPRKIPDICLQPLRFCCSHLSNSSLFLCLCLPLFLTNTHTHKNSCLSQWAHVSECQHLSGQGPDIRVRGEICSGLSAQWDQCVLIPELHCPNYIYTTRLGWDYFLVYFHNCVESHLQSAFHGCSLPFGLFHFRPRLCTMLEN